MEIKHKPDAPMTEGEILRLDYWGASGQKPDVLPLAVDARNERMIVDAHGHDVAMMYGAKKCRPQNAAYLVHAANAYPALVETLRNAKLQLSVQTASHKAIVALLSDLGEAG